MNISVKRLLILFSICLNIGFILFGSYYYIKERAEGTYQRGFSKRGMHMSFYRDLNLSPEQEAKIKKLLEGYFKEQSSMRTENKNLRNELIYTIAREKKTDQKKLNQILERIAMLKKNREKATVEHLLKVKELLTEEQADKMFSKLIEQTKKVKK